MFNPLGTTLLESHFYACKLQHKAWNLETRVATCIEATKFGKWHMKQIHENVERAKSKLNTHHEDMEQTLNLQHWLAQRYSTNLMLESWKLLVKILLQYVLLEQVRN